MCFDIAGCIDVLEKQRPGPVDGIKAEAYMLIDRSTKCDVFNVFFPYFGCVLLD